MLSLPATSTLWKYQPVVATSVTGLRLQIIDGRNGYLVDDTETCAQVALRLIYDRDLWRKLGKRAHTLIKNNYLLPVMTLEYLEALKKALGMSATTSHPQAPLDIALSSQPALHAESST